MFFTFSHVGVAAMNTDQSLEYQAVVIATLREGIDRVTQATQSGLSAAELALEAQQIRHRILELQSAARIQALDEEVRRLQEELALSRRQARDWKMLFQMTRAAEQAPAADAAHTAELHDLDS